MGITELPSELFRMKNVKFLSLNANSLCSLPSDIAQLETLATLYVRLSKRLDRDLTAGNGVSGLQQPAHVSSARTRSADQSQEAFCAELVTSGSQSDPACFQLGANQLTSLPAEIGQLRQLEALSVRNSN
jgi:Leucine-rich repeat (LRR) protein